MRYFLTFACYGSHLPGDERGTIDRDHNTPGTRAPNPNPRRADLATQSLLNKPYRLSPEARNVVIQTLQEVCQHRNWNLLAAQARTNHVHAIVEAETAPEPILNTFKSYATRALNKIEPEQKRWARHGSTRYLWKDQDVQSAMQYVIEEQGDPMAHHIAPTLTAPPALTPLASVPLASVPQHSEPRP